MKKLDWYIIKKFLGTFFFALALILLIVIIFDISEKIDDFLEHEVSLKAIIFENRSKPFEKKGVLNHKTNCFLMVFGGLPKVNVFKTITFRNHSKRLGSQALSGSYNIGNSNTFERFPKSDCFCERSGSENHTVSKVSNFDCAES